MLSLSEGSRAGTIVGWEFQNGAELAAGSTGKPRACHLLALPWIQECFTCSEEAENLTD